MIGTTAALIGSALAGLGSSAIGAISANKASGAQADAANNAATVERQNALDALNFNKQQYGNTLQMLSPYYGIGTNAVNRLAYLMGIPGSPATFDPNKAGAALNGTANGGGGLPGVSLLQLLRGGNLDLSNLGQRPTAGGGAVSMSPFSNVVPSTTGSVVNGGFGVNGVTGMNDHGTAGTGVPGNGAGSNFAVNPAGLNPSDSTMNFGSPGFQVPALQGNTGDYGSLAQDFTDKFVAPTDVTEQNDPGFQFRLKQGLDALQKSAAARGSLLTGGTLKAINDYAQGQASNEYGNVYNRAANEYAQRYNIFNQNQANKFNRFATLAGLGQTSAGQIGSAATNTAGNVGNILLNSGANIGNDLQNYGAARGSGYVGASNAITGGLSGLMNNITLLSLLKGNGGFA